jgi:crotonobetainyl-CoA:carnitine CoA-transferase CaiB-like acyl-CoA transferase
LADPQSVHLQLVQTMTLPNGVLTQTVGCPVRFDGKVLKVNTSPPALNANAQEIRGKISPR